MPKDYYLILGITSDATLDDIKEAYRRLAKEFHPDHYGENLSPFLDIQEAYSVLSDPIKRQTHDLTGFSQKKKLKPRYGETIKPNPKRPVEPLIPEPEAPLDMETASLARSFHSYRPSHDQFFDRLFSNFRPTSRPKNEHLENLNVVITLTPEQAFRGGQIEVALPAERVCPSCAGHGWIGVYKCWKCNGEGGFLGEYPVMISYPSGISNKHLVQMPLDTYGIRNVYLTVHFRVSELF